MVANDNWRVSEHLTVEQAVWLMLDIDPPTHFGSTSIHEPAGFAPLFVALTSTIRTGGLRATVDGTQIGDQPFGANAVDPDWQRTWVRTEHLKTWMKSIGVTPRVFFPNDSAGSARDLFDDYKEFPGKLRAAIDAHRAVKKDWHSNCGKTVKQALTDWIGQRAGQYGLKLKDGRLNHQGIEQAASLANWELKGGAPRTPDINR